MKARNLAAVPLLLLAGCLPRTTAPGRAPLAGFRPPAEDMVQPAGLPRLYKWMLAPDLVAAHWLGARVGGRELVEPLNLVLIDRRAAGPEEAKAALAEAMAAAGFPSRFGHSGGYFAFVDGGLRGQFPAEPNHAFSDQPFELPNDHGRVFGPVPIEGGQLFVAAFSREGIAPLAKVKHDYISFNRARDTVADRLDARSGYKRRGFVDLGNALTEDPGHSTGDHDGLAVRLERR